MIDMRHRERVCVCVTMKSGAMEQEWRTLRWRGEEAPQQRRDREKRCRQSCRSSIGLRVYLRSLD